MVRIMFFYKYVEVVYIRRLGDYCRAISIRISVRGDSVRRWTKREMYFDEMDVVRKDQRANFDEIINEFARTAPRFL